MKKRNQFVKHATGKKKMLKREINPFISSFSFT